MHRMSLTLLVLLSSAAPVQSESASPSASSDAPVYSQPRPPGTLVDIGGRNLHVQCKGTAQGPTVIFEAGLSQYTANSTYGKAQDLIASFAHVCIYDRAGFGWSDPVAGPRTHFDMVTDLHKLVEKMELKLPLVLAGHSMGGLIARLYAKTYPGEVAGMILIEASPESYIYGPGTSDERKAIVAKIDAGLTNAKEGMPVVPMPAATPYDVQMAFTPSILRTVKQEYEAIDLVPERFRMADGYGNFGEKPLIIIRRGKTASPPSDQDEQWRKVQESMASLSTNSSLIVAEKSGHVVPYDEPAVVADAVKEVLAKVSR
jgi:pimeloyl-ACP methyl ester carboxylesterase